MEHDLKIRVSKRPPSDGIVACRRVTLREKLLTRLLGPLRNMTVMLFDESVDSITGTELSMGGAGDEQN